MEDIPWGGVVLYMLAIELLALYGLSVSGQFPAERRKDALTAGGGPFVLWTTLVLAAATAVLAVTIAAISLPWFASIIGGGAMLLIAPLALRPFPDRIVDGRASLVLFTAAGALATAAFYALGR